MMPAIEKAFDLMGDDLKNYQQKTNLWKIK